jgi:hypothetical protein
MLTRLNCPQWLAEYRVSQPVRVVDLHHLQGHDRVKTLWGIAGNVDMAKSLWISGPGRGYFSDRAQGSHRWGREFETLADHQLGTVEFDNMIELPRLGRLPRPDWK